MTSDTMILAVTGLAGLFIVALTAMRCWQGWLSLKARELDLVRPAGEPGSPEGKARIELADLRERIRKLEAIAAGVDL